MIHLSICGTATCLLISAKCGACAVGGIGSGNRWQSGRATTDAMLALDVRKLIRDGLLTPQSSSLLTWRRQGEKIGSIRLLAMEGAVRLIYTAGASTGQPREMDYRVFLDETPCNFGGSRSWFLCPASGCGKRVAIIYGGSVFACRACYGLAYSSQRQSPSERAGEQVERIRKRLGWDGETQNGEGLRPKGMHEKTFNRLLERYYELDARSMHGIIRHLERLGAL